MLIKKKSNLEKKVSSLTTLKYTQELSPFQSGRQMALPATVMILASANMAYGMERMLTEGDRRVLLL